MTLTLQTEPVPLSMDEHGTIRVGASRVLVELVIRAYQDGLTAEQIGQRFDTLELADVYAVLAYYLRHRTEMDDYLRRRATEAEKIRQQIETALPPRATREELLARWAAQQGA